MLAAYRAEGKGPGGGWGDVFSTVDAVFLVPELIVPFLVGLGHPLIIISVFLGEDEVIFLIHTVATVKRTMGNGGGCEILFAVDFTPQQVFKLG